jgi:hypothetical protein
VPKSAGKPHGDFSGGCLNDDCSGNMRIAQIGENIEEYDLAENVLPWEWFRRMLESFAGKN